MIKSFRALTLSRWKVAQRPLAESFKKYVFTAIINR